MRSRSLPSTGAPVAAPSRGAGAPGPSLSLRFAATARILGELARAESLVAPAFRSPPRVPGVGRTVRRNPDGTCSVSVALRDRPWGAVVADMIEGLVVANELAGPPASRLRDAAWRQLDEVDLRGSSGVAA